MALKRCSRAQVGSVSEIRWSHRRSVTACCYLVSPGVECLTKSAHHRHPTRQQPIRPCTGSILSKSIGEALRGGALDPWTFLVVAYQRGQLNRRAWCLMCDAPYHHYRVQEHDYGGDNGTGDAEPPMHGASSHGDQCGLQEQQDVPGSHGSAVDVQIARYRAGVRWSHVICRRKPKKDEYDQ